MAKRAVLIGMLLLSATASGCVSVMSAGGQLETGTQFDGSSPDADAIVVIGVSRIYAVTVVSGTDDGVSWHRQRRPTGARAMADDGFVAIKLKPRQGQERYAIASVALDPDATDRYPFPDSSTILVFDAPPGKVTYLGGIDAQIASEGMHSFAILRDNPAITRQQAAAFMARRYPRIGNQLVTGKLDWLYRGDAR